MAVLGLIVFVAMILVAGLAVDMMRYENERVRMQAASDRAVIAATMLRENPANPTPLQIVQAYFAAEGLAAQIDGNVRVVEDPNTGRTVTVVPAATVPTLFMRMIGINDFSLATLAEANEAIQGGAEVEIVMVLDVSGSMSANTANGLSRIANLRNAAVDLAEDLLRDAELGSVAFSIVPYDSWVLPPAGFTNFFTNSSGSGACMDFVHYDVVTDTFDRQITRRNCPTNNWRLVRPFMHDADDVIAAINDLRPSGTTSIDLGLHVGAMLFDPTINPAMEQWISNGLVDPVFADRPHQWNAPGVIRAMILMTDGANCCGARGNTQQLDANTIATCLALRDMGVHVYAVAFEAPSGGVSLMQQCASSENHFFNTSGAGLSDVFAGIGNHIQTQALRLTR